MGKRETEEQEPGFQTATVDDTGRFSLPMDCVETVKWLVGAEDVHGWLLVMSPGRLRLLSDDQVTRSKALKGLRDRILNIDTETEHTEPYRGGSAAKAALVTRMLPLTLHCKSGYWRVKLPARLRQFRTITNHRVVVLLAGPYIEIWSEASLEAAWEHPLEELLE